MYPKDKKRMLRRGFTIIEILAATGIMLVVMAIVLGLTSSVLSTWTTASQKLSRVLDARQALDLMVADLEAAIIKNDESAWLEIASGQIQTQGGTIPPLGSNINVNNTESIFFFSQSGLRPSRLFTNNFDLSSYVSLPGTTSAVAYGVAYQDPFDLTTNNEKMFYALYRLSVDPALTNEAFIRQATRNQGLIGSVWSNTNDFLSTGTASSGGRLTTSTQGLAHLYQKDNLLSLNVMRMDIRLAYYNAVADSWTTYNLTAGNSHNIPLDSPFDDHVLSYIEVSLVVLSDEGARLMRFSNNLPTTGEGWEEFMQEYSEVYTRRVKMAMTDTLTIINSL